MGEPAVASEPRPLNDIILELEFLAIRADRIEKITQVAEGLRHGYATGDTEDPRSRVIDVMHHRAVADAVTIRRGLEAIAAELKRSKLEELK